MARATVKNKKAVRLFLFLVMFGYILSTNGTKTSLALAPEIALRCRNFSQNKDKTLSAVNFKMFRTDVKHIGDPIIKAKHCSLLQVKCDLTKTLPQNRQPHSKHGKVYLKNGGPPLLLINSVPERRTRSIFDSPLLGINALPFKDLKLVAQEKKIRDIFKLPTLTSSLPLLTEPFSISPVPWLPLTSLPPPKLSLSGRKFGISLENPLNFKKLDLFHASEDSKNALKKNRHILVSKFHDLTGLNKRSWKSTDIVHFKNMFLK